MNSYKDSAKLENTNQAWSGWGYNLVLEQISNAGTAQIDLKPLFDYVSDHETCFLEFKATPFFPDQKFSKDNPFGHKEGESVDDYAWNVAKAIIALANTAGGAIILGVSDKGHEPIEKICKKKWEGELWDDFSSTIREQIIKEKYSIFDREKNQRRLITIENAYCEKLRPRCDIRCCHYKNHTIPLIIVPAIQDSYQRIWAKDGEKEFLLVRSRGDVGKTEILTGRKAANYIPPDKDSYIPSRSTNAPSANRFWNNLSVIPKIVGRKDKLAELNGRLLDSDNVQWIYGDAGIGKTAFVQNYIATYCRENFESPFDIAFFIDAKDLTFSEAICRLNTHAAPFENFSGIKLNDGEESPLSEILRPAENAKPQLFKSWALRIIERLNTYQGPGGILITFDNVDKSNFLCDDQIDLIFSITQARRRIKFCVTSRIAPACDDHVSVFDLPNLTGNDALCILNEKRTIRNEDSAAQEIVTLCNHNARAISIIADQLEDDSDPNPYARKLAELKRLGIQSMPSKGKADEELKTLLGQPIDRLRKKDGDGDRSIHLFALSVWFNPDDIPASCLNDAFKRFLVSSQSIQSSQDIQIEWENCIKNLRQEGMIELHPNSETYEIRPFWRDVFFTLPEPYRVWKYAFETIKHGLFLATQTEQQTLAKWHDRLIDFISLTVSKSSRVPAQDQNVSEIVKWIDDSEKWKTFLRKMAENFGYADKIKNICNYLFEVAEFEYKTQSTVNSAQTYIFFLSVKKTIAAKWEQDIQLFNHTSKKLRTTFLKLNKKSEKQEIHFAKELIYDARQNDKFDHYRTIEKDLDQAFEILLHNKSRNRDLLVKSYIERVKIEFGFKKYRKAKRYLNELIKLTRTFDINMPNVIIRGFCKEQKAYMHLCKGETATILARWFHHWRALKRYSMLIDEMSPRPDEHPLYGKSRQFILFKSHYFKAIVLLQKGKEEEAMQELKTTYDLCDAVFNKDQVLDDLSALLEFNKYRIRAGILRLQDELKKAQDEDEKASNCYNNNFASTENLDFADLKDDHGNTYALLGQFDKAIDYVQEALNIRARLLPSTHVKIQSSTSRLAYLYGIRALENGERARAEIKKLTAIMEYGKDCKRLLPYSEPIIRKLEEITEFNNLSKETFLKQIRRDEQREECERVRSVIADFQEKLFEEQTKNYSEGQT